MKLSVKKGDNVLVLSGKDKGKQGEVLEVNKETNRVLVAGVNIQTKHKKPRNKDDKGGILKTEGAIDVSNVQVVCPTCKKATRVAHKLENDKNVRICKKCGAVLDVAVKKSSKSTKTAAKAKAEKPAKVEKVEAEQPKPAKKTAVKSSEKPAAKTTKSTTKTTAKKETTAKTSGKGEKKA